ncbi:uncharacterized protein PG986_007801 [Apiospora aurea]|uniref:Pt repeat family protein n=1 Tax=Apiospora aurea TaxID=335848 RepID=A0ABR1QDL1_9PEZI
MAWSAPKGRPKVFQTRLRTFVKTLRRTDSRKSGETSDNASTIQSREARDATDDFQTTQSQPDLIIAASPELAQEQGLVSTRPSTEASLREPHRWEAEEEGQESSWAISGPLAPQNSDEKPGLSVRVSLRFENPLEFTYSRNYDSSPTLRVTENLCQGLIRRIDHSCYELITRKDPNASAATKGKSRTKPKRFELTTQISQGGELWATRTYTSYQKDPVTAEAAKEVILSSNRMIGLFLKRHDPDFIWRIGPLHDDLHPLPETQKSPYQIGSIQSLNCVPRSEFIEKTQTFEATPGYKLDLSFSFLNRQGEVPWQKDIEVSSNQTTPLTLAVAENLFSDASYALEGAVRSRRRHVQEQHAQCRFDAGTCQHYLEEASEIALRITNNFGPDFDHLARSIQSKLVLFEEYNAQDCGEFVDNLQNAIAEARNSADVAIIETNDLDLKIVELRGSGWALDEPLVFTIPPSTSYSRRSIEAILDRVQTGISDVLRGNAATVRYIAWKRGHLILDKTLVAREPKSPTRRWDTSTVTRSKVVNKLRRRVEQDIEMICKDTCSLGDMEEEDPPSASVDPAQPTAEAPVSAAQPDADNEEPSLPYIPSMGPRLAPTAKSVSVADVESSVGSHQLSEEDRPSSAVHSATSMNSRSSQVYRDPKTGHRAFPLVPSASTYGVTELLKQPDPQPDPQPDSQTKEKEPDMPGTTSPTALPIEDVLQNSNSQHASKADSNPTSQKPKMHDGTAAGEHWVRENAAPVTEPEDAGVHEAESEPARSPVSPQHCTFATRQGSIGYQPSTVPSTPSLISGHGQSPRSSMIVATPQISGSMSSAELQFMMARRNSAGKRFKRARFWGGTIHARRNIPQPSEEGHYSTSSEGAQINDVDGHELPNEASQDANGTPSGSVGIRRSNATLVPSPESGLEAASSKETTPDIIVDSFHSQAGTSKYGLNPPKTPSDAGFTFEGDDFAQTREEIDFSAASAASASAFSSPWSTSTVAGGDYTTLPPPEMRFTSINGELHDVFDDDNEHAIADDNQSSCMGLSAPSSPVLSAGAFSRPKNASSSSSSASRARGSFGSAGLLGLADSQNLLGVGLRRALAMNNTPPRRMGGSTGRELQILKRPSLLNVDVSQRPASSGRELETRYLREGPSSRHHHPDHHDAEKPQADPEALMKRSLSSNVLQDYHVREVVRQDKKKKKTLQDGAEDERGAKDKDTVEEGDEQRPGAGRPRSSSLMFLLAGATLASQMMRPD